MSFTTRLASPEDIPALADVQVSAWKAAYRGLIDQQMLDSLRAEDRVDLWQRVVPDAGADVFVTEIGGRVTGFIAVRAWDEDPSMAWVPTVYVRPSYWRQGQGRALMQEAIRAARARGCSSLFLWVLEDNSAARRFYERVGLQFDGASQIDSKSTGSPLRELRYSMQLPEASGVPGRKSAS